MEQTFSFRFIHPKLRYETLTLTINGEKISLKERRKPPQPSEKPKAKPTKKAEKAPAKVEEVKEEKPVKITTVAEKAAPEVAEEQAPEWQLKNQNQRKQ